jgi:hypothetical protein
MSYFAVKLSWLVCPMIKIFIPLKDSWVFMDADWNRAYTTLFVESVHRAVNCAIWRTSIVFVFGTKVMMNWGAFVMLHYAGTENTSD